VGVSHRLYKTIILSLVLYGCETWSLILREEHRLRVLFGPKKDELVGEWRKLHNEELHNFHSSPSIIRMTKSRMRWAGHVVQRGEKRNTYWLLVGKPEGKRPLGRPRHRWMDNMKMDFGEIGLGGGLTAFDSGVESSRECSNEHSSSVKCWEISQVAAQPVASRVVLSSIDWLVFSFEFMTC
jgi:hypothetical protein